MCIEASTVCDAPFKPMNKYLATLTTSQKEAWIDALLSGAYAQGRHVLRRTRTLSAGNGSSVLRQQHCPLGVLAEILGMEFVTSDSGDYITWCIDGQEPIKYSISLPDCVLDRCAQDSFMEANDSHHLSFEDIAKLVNEHVPVTDS